MSVHPLSDSGRRMPDKNSDDVRRERLHSASDEGMSEIVESEPDFCPITGTTKRQRDAIGRMIWPVPIQLQPPNGCHRFLLEWDEM